MHRQGLHRRVTGLPWLPPRSLAAAKVVRSILHPPKPVWRCEAVGTCLSVITGQPACVELVRRALTASLHAAPLSAHAGAAASFHSIINGAPNGATVWFTTVCALSVALAALIFNLLSILAQLGPPPEAEKSLVLHGVDVTNSRFFRDERVLAAVEFAAQAHAGQVRKTGEPYVSHCLETALIVEHNLPPASEYERYALAIIAALLHDVVDDTNVELSAIKAKFGPHVASMVAQVSKLSQMNQLLRRGKRKGWAEYGPQHFKSLRKMIVDMVFEEPLVILIKLADRLHNMRTVFVLKPDKQKAVAEETLEVWCTMAECLGWDALKSEMEDLCFAVLHPDQYCALRAQLDRIWSLPSLKVVVDQADSSSLPANALAPAPPFSARSRRVAAASAARKAAAAARAAAAAAVQALVPAGGPAAPAAALAAVGTHTPHGSTRGRSMRGDRSDELNLGIRIVASPRGPAETASTQGGEEGPSWDLVSWSVDNEQGGPHVTGRPTGAGTAAAGAAAAAGASSGHGATSGPSVAGGRHTHPDVLLQAWAGTLNSSAVQEVTASSVAALVAADPSTLQAATTTTGVHGSSMNSTYDESASSSSDEADVVMIQAQMSRLHSHSQAGPGPASGTSASSGGGRAWSAATATLIASKQAAAAAAISTTVAPAGVRTATLVRPTATATTTTTTPNSLPAITSLLSADEIEAVLRSKPDPPSTTKATKSSTNSTALPAVLFTQEQLASGYTALPAASSSTRPGTRLTAAATGAGTSTSGLLPQQERLRSLISTVVPFDSVNFKDTRSLSISTRRGLEVLDECAALLYSEVQLRSSGGGLSLQIQGRLKSLNSVYRKMVRKGCSVAEVYDARALRVIVGDDNGSRTRDAVEACYKLVSTVHSIWKPIPQEFDDYIANPKPSGYQALHTAVKGPGGIPMEVQIKTSSMHELAEYGAAAHWVYKEYAQATSVLMPISPANNLSSADASPQLPTATANRVPTSPSPSQLSAPAHAPSAAVLANLPPYTPPLRLKGRGWPGQPVLRVAKDKLRYGVVVTAENEGRNLLVAIKSGPTSVRYPIRIADYGFYRALVEYVQAKGWRVPGCSDFNVRLEEFVYANDGRFHRKDHMGYVLPAEVITLLEGYEEEADAAARNGHITAAMATANHNADSGKATGPMTTAGIADSAAVAAAEALLRTPPPVARQAHAAPLAGDVSAQASDMAGIEAMRSADPIDGDEGALPDAAGALPPCDPTTDRLRRQMNEAYLRTQQLRTMIEWGRAAMGRYHKGGSEPGDEVSVLVWPGGAIEHWPRGTTVAQLVRAKGIITLSAMPEPPDIRPSATAVAGGDDGWMYAHRVAEAGADGLAGRRGAPADGVSLATLLEPPKPLVNVNNRLVPEDTVLNDGDLVILAREKVKI